MSLPAFDTYKAVKSLTKAGAAEPLAEAVVTTIGIAMGEHMATKADLKSLEERLNARIDSLEQRMTIRLGGLIVIGVAVLATIDKLL